MSDIRGQHLLLGALVVVSLASCGKDEGQSETGTISAPVEPPPVSAQVETPAPAPELLPQSTMVTFAAAGLPDSLIKNGCYSCHDVNGARIGPPLRAVAGLYRTDPEAIDKLTQKTIHGGGGVWGPAPMIAHPHLTAEQVRPMIEAILKLN